jgi:hypothetical protein
MALRSVRSPLVPGAGSPSPRALHALCLALAVLAVAADTSGNHTARRITTPSLNVDGRAVQPSEAEVSVLLAGPLAEVSIVLTFFNELDRVTVRTARRLASSLSACRGACAGGLVANVPP